MNENPKRSSGEKVQRRLRSLPLFTFSPLLLCALALALLTGCENLRYRFGQTQKQEVEELLER